MNKLPKLYENLLKEYGVPGPWPWFGRDQPHTPEEIAIGAILTQNTNRTNVGKALERLREANACTISGIYRLGKRDYNKLKILIRPSGFFNQKAKRLLEFSRYIIEVFGTLKKFFSLPLRQARNKLLCLNGIGPETADTILLYAGNKPAFVIDCYTQRFVKRYKLTRLEDYQKLQEFFTRNLPKKIQLYQAFHALIIRWGKDQRPKTKDQRLKTKD